jgi:putative ABC transport system permease protein
MWLRRLWNALRPARTWRDIDRELTFHIAERADQLESEGLSHDEAMRRARIRFGNEGLQAERTRDMDVAGWADGLVRNVRYALRGLARTPAFTATVVLTLALGIGANAAMFSAIHAVLLKPLPFPDADRLVRVRQALEAETAIAPPRLEDWSRLGSSLETLSGYYVEDVTDTTLDVPERTRLAVVAPRFLETLRVAPAMGAGFGESGLRVGDASVVLISDRYWRGRFASDPRVLERTLRLEGRPHAIVGVMPATFLVPDREVDLWRPYPADGPAAQDGRENRRLQWYTGIGRLKPGATPEQAHADITAVQARLAERFPETDAGIGVRVVPYKETVVAGVGGSLWLLYGAVSVLLLIACTNIAALFLSRVAQREHEFAVRLSLGASRPSIAAQVLTEAGVVALAGVAAGLLLTAASSALFRALVPELPRVHEMGIDARILAYTLATALVAALACGLVPAARAARAAPSLVRASRAEVSTRHSFQWILVGVQVACSLTLLVGAGLLVRSFEKLSRAETGFDPSHVLAFRVSGSWDEAEDRARLVQRIQGMIEELQAIPGVAAAATSWRLPGVPGQYATQFELLEGRAETEAALAAEWRSVSPGYFETMRIPLTAGGPCREPNVAAESSELVVNRLFADRYFPGRQVVGLHLSWEAGANSGAIVGIAGNARERGLDRAPVPTVYTCNSAPSPFPWFQVRSSGDPRTVAGAIRARIKELEPLRSVYDVSPLEQRLRDAYAGDRLRLGLLVSFAAVALSLACLGVYGTLNHVVSLRRREVGLRLALGALRRDIVRQFVGRALRVVACACLGGLAMSVALNRLLSGMLYGVSPWDPVTFSAAVGVVLAVAVLAALVPATRAAWIEPMQALRGR